MGQVKNRSRFSQCAYGGKGREMAHYVIMVYILKNKFGLLNQSFWQFIVCEKIF